jgi:hypothetical protein
MTLEKGVKLILTGYLVTKLSSPYRLLSVTTRHANYPEGFSEGSLTWMQVGKKIVDALADEWFATYAAKDLSAALTPAEIDYDEKGRIVLNTGIVEGNGYKIIPEFCSSLKKLDLEPVPIAMSTLGQSLLKNLKTLELLFDFDEKLLISDEEYLEIPHEVAMTANLPWATYFGSRFLQSFEIYKDSKGKEYCYWHSTVLFGTRPKMSYRSIEILADIDDRDSAVEIELSQEEIDRGVLTFGDWSTKIHIPWITKCLFYLGETPFPSSFVNMSRSIAYSGLDESKMPMPYVDIVYGSKVTCSATKQSKLGHAQYLGRDVIAPQQVRMGWMFTAEDLDSQKIILTTITEALVRINSYLQDGYLNHNAPDSSFCFDGVLGSDNQLSRKSAENGSQSGYSRWVPVPEVFELLEETEQIMDTLSKSTEPFEEHESEVAWVVDEGVGNKAVASAINDAIFYYFIPREQWGGLSFYASTAIAMNVPNQTTNAYSNWGIAEYTRGNYENATTLFLAALERIDKFAEDEASFYLSKIFEKQGKTDQAEIYRKRCEAAGGYTPTFE